jgi:hypothetical protein
MASIQISPVHYVLGLYLKAASKAVVLLVKSSAFTGQKQCFSNAPMTPIHATAPLLR